MEPWLAPNDKRLLYTYLDKSSVYFEYGSGGSTYQASLRKNIRQIYSVESDKIWHTKLRDILKDKQNITYLYNEMESIPNTCGYPGPNSTELQKKNYSNSIFLLDEGDRKKIDLVLIDGRFRIACCLKCFDAVNDTCCIAFDDFLDRPGYHIVLQYYDILEKTEDNRLVILQKKKGISVPKELIAQYELSAG